MTVPFLGTRICAARGLEWLHRKTGATVLPAVLLWEGHRGQHLHIGPPIAGSQGSAASPEAGSVMAPAYAVLERYVRRDPGQWLKWEDFAQMISP